MEIEPLTWEDVPAAMNLVTQVGWNQTSSDWNRLLSLAPQGCFGGRVDGDLVATATLVTYNGKIGWIGMVLVDEEHRRNGYGSRLFQRALKAALERDVDIGLDATDEGREVYRRSNFIDVVPIERWGGMLSPVAADKSIDVRPTEPTDIESVCAFDSRTCGTDRAQLLRHLMASDGVSGFVADRHLIQGYAVVRPGRMCWHIGPVVARSRSVVEALLNAVADAVNGDVLIDVPDAGRIADLLRGAGLHRQRQLTRMSFCEPKELLLGEQVVAVAGFEFG